MLQIQQYIKSASLDEAYELLQKNRNNQILGGMIWLRCKIEIFLSQLIAAIF